MLVIGAYLKQNNISGEKYLIEELFKSTFSHWCILEISFKIIKSLLLLIILDHSFKINRLFLFSDRLLIEIKDNKKIEIKHF